MIELADDLAASLETEGGNVWAYIERVRASLYRKLTATVNGEDVPAEASTSEGRSWPGADVAQIRRELERKLCGPGEEAEGSENE